MLIRRLVDWLVDWVCARLGLCIDLGGDLMAPSGDEEWWPLGGEDGLDGSAGGGR